MAKKASKQKKPSKARTPIEGPAARAAGKLAQRHFIRAWRKYRDLTQEQMAERIGIARSYLSLIEKGKRRYDQPFLEAAAEVLNCQPADLIMRDPTDPAAIWSVWEQIPPTERDQARRVLESVFVKKKTGTLG